jgi:hypothetical protein
MMGRWGMALVVSLALGLMLAGVAFGQTQGESPASQASQGQTWVGIDADTAGNTASSLGPIDGCISVATGQTVTVDVFIMDVQALAGWQGELSYDNSVVTIVDVDPRLLLAANPDSQVVSLSPDSLPDTDGIYSPLVADMGDRTGESGEGVLIRLTLQAVGSGRAELTLSDVALGDPSAAPIGDTNSDTYFDGPVSGAEIRVDEACPSGTPISQPSPAATPEAPTLEATPPATATSPPEVASPTSEAAPANLAKEEGGNGIPWVLIGGIGGGAALAVLLLAFGYRQVLRRAR